MRWLFLAAAALLALAGAAYALDLHLAVQDRIAYWRFDESGVGFKDAAGREPVACEADRVILVFGQSLAANSGEGPHTSVGDVRNLNIHDGRCYRARDPLLGPGGEEGSIWSRLGDRLPGSTLFVPIAIGGGSINRWSEGDLRKRLARALELARPTAIVWMQGQADARAGAAYAERRPAAFEREGDGWTMKAEAYIAEFGEIHEAIRKRSDAPIYVAVSTKCGNAGSDAIRAAQREIPRRFAGVRQGPDLDALPPAALRDGCHLSAQGLEMAAELWAPYLRAP